MNISTTRAGYVAIIGRPNVGKSTLLNRILGKKISITSRKPQTTRHKILGIKTTGNFQTIYVDTPGIHNKNERMLNRYMNKAALSTLSDVDVIVFMVAGTIWHKEDEMVLQILQQAHCPIILVINKIDVVAQKEQLLECIKVIGQKREFNTIIPISAQDGTNVLSLEKAVQKLLPESPFYFPSEQLTDRDNKFLVAESIREKLTRFLGQELPYAISVVVDQMVVQQNIMHIAATIYVERDGQKAIIIGKDGDVLKKVGTLARKDMEELFAQKVFLRLWVKVKSGWTDDKTLLQQFGYED
ncbi:MAG: GTPase Era [bacterium]